MEMELTSVRRAFPGARGRESTAVAHRGLDLVERAAHAVLEGTCVGYVRVDALVVLPARVHEFVNACVFVGVRQLLRFLPQV